MPSGQLVIGKEWMDFVEEEWWSPTNIVTAPSVSSHVEKVLEILMGAWGRGDYERAWQEIDRIENKYLDMSTVDAGLAFKTCGQVLLKMDNTEGAERSLRKARYQLARSLEQRHFYAVINWILGCVQWLRPGQHTEAINNWEKVIKVFEDLAGDSITDVTKMGWYREQIGIMKLVLEKAIELDELPPLNDILILAGAASGMYAAPASPSGSGPTPASPPSSKLDDEAKPAAEVVLKSAVEQVAEEEEPILFEDFFQLPQLQVVYDEIPAGMPAPLSDSQLSVRNPLGFDDLEPKDHIEVTRVKIGDHEYGLQNLRAGKMINLTGDKRYYILKVKGHSMNQANILNGDYVVIRSQSAADDGDIVAAEIRGVDTRATLKRFRIKGKKVYLVPQSDAPEFTGDKDGTEFAKDLINEAGGFYIRGIAVAVLKRIS